MPIQDIAFVAVFAPLIGFLIAGISVKQFGDRFAQVISCLMMLLALSASILVFADVGLAHHTYTINLFEWITVGTFKVVWGLKLDTLSAVMLIVVNGVSALVHLYSVGYMSHDASIPRFMSYLSLFTFAMLALVTAPNFLQLFFGWEGVGVASYLLIGFWYERASAGAAAIKAFLVNRVGDVALALGIAAVYLVFDTVDFATFFDKLAVMAAAPARPMTGFLGYQVDTFNLIALLLFIGAMGKSAQLGLHTWLPDAMEGPTPVSALIHAATMVTAGVFLVARLSPLYELAPFARDVVIVVGATTAFFAATVALTQTDIKRVIAYSTCSQLGYMFFAAGCSAYNAAIFHLVTHAFFKALLFLGAGSVIHAMSDEQDMTKMGGIYKLIPKTYAFMWIGSLALAGIPFFAGYYSKDAVIESAYLTGTNIGLYAFVVGLIVAFLTAFYSWRLLLLTFHGRANADDKVMAHVHESPLVMLLPLAVLSIGAMFSGYIGMDLFMGAGASAFWQKSIVVHSAHHGHVPFAVIIAPLICAVSGIVFAYFCYGNGRQLPQKIATSFAGIYQFLLNKWYFDEIYEGLFIKRAHNIGDFFWQRGDVNTIDRFGPDGIAKMSLLASRLSTRLQTGYVYHYAFSMLVGLVCLLAWYLLSNIGIGHAR